MMLAVHFPIVEAAAPANAKLRFMCDASGNQNEIEPGKRRREPGRQDQADRLQGQRSDQDETTSGRRLSQPGNRSLIANPAYLTKFAVAPDRNCHPHVFPVPQAQLGTIAKMVQVVTHPVQCSEALLLEHDVIQEHGVKHAVPHIEHKRDVTAFFRNFELDIQRVMKIRRADIGETIARRRPNLTIGKSDFRQDISTILIDRADRCHGPSDYNRTAGTIGVGDLICRVLDFKNLKMIDVVRLQHFVAKIQLEIPVLDTFETQLV